MAPQEFLAAAFKPGSRRDTGGSIEIEFGIRVEAGEGHIGRELLQKNIHALLGEDVDVPPGFLHEDPLPREWRIQLHIPHSKATALDPVLKATQSFQISP